MLQILEIYAYLYFKDLLLHAFAFSITKNSVQQHMLYVVNKIPGILAGVHYAL